MSDTTVNYRGIVSITDRKKIELDNVEHVLGFDESFVSLMTKFGKVSIEGNELKIEDLSNESGKIRITGIINGVYFSVNKQKKGIKGLFS